ncbi:ABC-type branched-chain amino acid transport system, periplasmic component [Natrinema pellirubrum DSM 15624]|uniref:ABC-type branched-chain amino acid transport system, periplasmic component n=1 Tax=Natrinema pellirubrum (strain DSM 15624 / CIP 106293 / JCM 10476 / NCIMB 786 / 157) TaxID=797303 RepID=L0JIX1_NATP1|nr:ABC-type branched-chain amino acid transport system, periplasmic component [Natrinema pellirubrum DSM 15624]
MAEDSCGRRNGGRAPTDTPARGPNRRRVLKTTAGGVAGLSLAGCLETAGSIVGDEEVEPVRIGVLAPDPDSNPTGQSIVSGAAIARAQLNDNGGIDGRDVELVLGDTNGSPLEARRQYQRLILEEKVDATIGIATTEVLMALMDDIAEQKVPHLTVGSATSGASQLVNEQYEEYKYHFRAGPINDVNLAETQIDFLDDMGAEIGWDSVAILVEDYDWTERLWRVYRNRLGDVDVDVAMQQRYPPATEDFSGIYDEVERSGADAAIVSAAHTGTQAVMDWGPAERPFAFGGIHVPMQLSSYYEKVNGACRYAAGYAFATPTAETTDKTQPFVQEYQNRNGGDAPVYTGYIAFDAIKLFADAAERAGTFDSDELVGALESTSFTGTTGTIEFHDADHEHAHDVIYGEDNVHPLYFQWRENDDGEGVQRTIWPDTYSTTDYVEPDWF